MPSSSFRYKSTTDFKAGGSGNSSILASAWFSRALAICIRPSTENGEANARLKDLRAFTSEQQPQRPFRKFVHSLGGDIAPIEAVALNLLLASQRLYSSIDLCIFYVFLNYYRLTYVVELNKTFRITPYTFFLTFLKNEINIKIGST